MRTLSVSYIIFSTLLSLRAVASAQTVTPVIVEYHGGAASGSFDVVNDSFVSLVITIEPQSFSIDRTGQAEFRPLDQNIRVSFSETSLRLPPKSRRTVFYKAAAESYPAWFSVYAIFRGLPRRNNMNVLLELPHTVYLLGDAKKSRASRGDLQFEELHVHGGVLSGAIRNVSGKVQRVAELTSRQPGHAKQESGGFPLLPGGIRDFDFKLADPDLPGRLRASFGGGSVVLETEVEAAAVPRDKHLQP